MQWTTHPLLEVRVRAYLLPSAPWMFSHLWSPEIHFPKYLTVLKWEVARTARRSVAWISSSHMYSLNPRHSWAPVANPHNRITRQQGTVLSPRTADAPMAPPVQSGWTLPIQGHSGRIYVSHMTPISRHSQGAPKAFRVQEWVSPGLPSSHLYSIQQ